MKHYDVCVVGLWFHWPNFIAEVKQAFWCKQQPSNKRPGTSNNFPKILLLWSGMLDGRTLHVAQETRNLQDNYEGRCFTKNSIGRCATNLLGHGRC